MDLAEADRRIRTLEERYHHLHRAAHTTASPTIAAEGRVAEAQDSGPSKEDISREKRAILREIELIEESLLD
jgi:hypothetical protein